MLAWRRQRLTLDVASWLWSGPAINQFLLAHEKARQDPLRWPQARPCTGYRPVLVGSPSGTVLVPRNGNPRHNKDEEPVPSHRIMVPEPEPPIKRRGAEEKYQCNAQ